MRYWFLILLVALAALSAIGQAPPTMAPEPVVVRLDAAAESSAKWNFYGVVALALIGMANTFMIRGVHSAVNGNLSVVTSKAAADREAAIIAATTASTIAADRDRRIGEMTAEILSLRVAAALDAENKAQVDLARATTAPQGK